MPFEADYWKRKENIPPPLQHRDNCVKQAALLLQPYSLHYKKPSNFLLAVYLMLYPHYFVFLRFYIISSVKSNRCSKKIRKQRQIKGKTHNPTHQEATAISVFWLQILFHLYRGHFKSSWKIKFKRWALGRCRGSQG